MSESAAVVIGVVGICVTVINGMGLFILLGIRQDLRAAKEEFKEEMTAVKADFEQQCEKIWRRIFQHGHEVICSNPDCHLVKLGGVIVPPELK